jgi:hypothetical protein
MTLQSTLYAGETLNYRASLAAYPASAGWVLHLVLGARTGSAPITVTGTAEGDAHLVQATSSTTAGWAPGAYGWELWAINGSERYRLDSGQLVVAPSLLGASASVDTRSDTQRAYDAVTALLQGKADSGVESYRINNRELKSYPLPDLIKLQAKLRSELSAERVAAGLQPLPGTGVQRILVRTR